MSRFNVWKFDSTTKNSTGGWIFIGVFHGLSEDHTISMAAIKFHTKKVFLRAYPHIDEMPEVKP